MSELDALVHEAWTADGARVKELWKTARKAPAFARSAPTVTWLKKAGSDGSHDRTALEWAAFALAVEGDPRVVPFLVPRAFERWDFARLLRAWAQTDRVDRERLGNVVRPYLLDDDAGVEAWKLAARCISPATPGAAEAVAKRLERCLDAMWSPDASQTVRMESHAASLGTSLLSLGVPSSFVPMLEAVASVDSRSIDRGRGTCAMLLASVGVGLDAITRGLGHQLEHGLGSRIAPGQLLALGALGKGLSAEARRSLGELVRKILGEREEGAERTVAAHAALVDLGEPAELEVVARRALSEKRYGWNDTVRQWVFVLDLVANRTELPVDLARPFVDDDDLRLYRAARRALASRGEAPSSHPSDIANPCILHTMTTEALCEALTSRKTPRSLVANELATRTTAETAPQLIRALEELPTARHEGDPRAETRRHLLRAMSRTGDARAVAIVTAAVENEPGDPPIAIEDLPTDFAATVARTYLRTKDKHVRERAKRWIAAHVSEANVETALTSLGLAKDDFLRRTR